MNRSSPFRVVLLAAALASILVLSGCTRRPLTLQAGEGAEVSHDGLHRVDGTRRFARVWLRPEASLAGYTKLLPIDAGVHYRRAPRDRRAYVVPTEIQVQRAQEALGDAFRDEVERSRGWEIVSERGPDVLVVRAALIDLYVSSDGPRSGRDRAYNTVAGKATLLVELFDSETLEILARFADRRAATRDDSSGWRDDTFSNRSAARALFRSWSRRFVEALDTAREITPISLEAERAGDGAVP